jgi:hypothetical protein
VTSPQENLRRSDRKFQRFGAVDEKAAAEAVLILDDPVAAAVPADAKQTRGEDEREEGGSETMTLVLEMAQAKLSQHSASPSMGRICATDLAATALASTARCACTNALRIAKGRTS